MCGIMGYLNKRPAQDAELGATMLKMLEALKCRGPDSVGVALYSSHTDGALSGAPEGAHSLWIKLGEHATTHEFEARAKAVTACASEFADVREAQHNTEYLRLLLRTKVNPKILEDAIEAVHADVEVISMGCALDLIKQVGSPDNLEQRFGISKMSGTHGIAHTRLSTESKIDLSHSQPFWAHGTLDVATVHNGHICNYHKLRRQYEQRGVRFYTENDSEIIGIYLGELMQAGATLTEALTQSVKYFDGSFSYLAATESEIGFAKDVFGLKPLIVTESENYVAIATEEVALRAVVDAAAVTWEPSAGMVKVWNVRETRSAQLKGEYAKY